MSNIYNSKKNALLDLSDLTEMLFQFSWKTRITKLTLSEVTLMTNDCFSDDQIFTTMNLEVLVLAENNELLKKSIIKIIIKIILL